MSPINPTANPTPATVPNPSTGNQPISTNFQAGQRRQNIQRPWGLRVYQGTNACPTPYNTTVQMGFDGFDYNTYQSIAGNNYSLQFQSATLGGHAFPYSGIVVPSYGPYDIKFQVLWNANTAGAPAWVYSTADILVNAAARTVSIETAIGNVAGQNYTQLTSDTLILNPGDVITFSLIQLNANSADMNTSPNGAFNYADIRYLGPA